MDGIAFVETGRSAHQYSAQFGITIFYVPGCSVISKVGLDRLGNLRSEVICRTILDR